MSASLSTPAAFIAHWQKAEANERANSQSFLIGLTQLLDLPQPSHNHADGGRGLGCENFGNGRL